MSALARPALHLGARGLVFAWHGPLGPMIARYASWSRERPEWVRGLGHPGADLPGIPELAAAGGGIVAAWCEEDGAWTSYLDDDGGEDGPRLVLPGAARVAIAEGGGGAALFGADERGIAAVELDERGVPRAEPRRLLSETRPPAALSAARARDESLCVAIHQGDAEWIAMTLGASGPSVVRHPHRRRIDDARVRAVGARAAVLLAGEGTVEMALLGAGGKVVERPHAVFPIGTARLAWPDAVWVDDHWVVLAREEAAGRLLAQPVGEKGAAFAFPRCEGPFAAAHRSQAFYALEVVPIADDAELRLFRCTVDGDEQQQRVDRVPNPAAPALRERRAIRHALGGLAEQLRHARGYRDAALRPALGRAGATLELCDDLGRLGVSAHPEAEGGVALRVSSALGDAPPLPPAPSSLVRLAGWVRARFSPVARQTLEARLAWARALARALGAELARVDRAGSTVILELTLPAMPPAEALVAWLRRLRDEQARAP